MARQARRPRDDEYDDHDYRSPPPRKRSNTGMLIVGIVVAISVIAVIVKSMSGSGPDPDDERAAVDVAKRCVAAGLENDMAQFKRSIDLNAKDGLSDLMSARQRALLSRGHFYDETPTAEDRKWIDEQWSTFLQSMRTAASEQLGLRSRGDIDSLFRTVEVTHRPSLGQIDVLVSAEGMEFTVYVVRSDDRWLVGSWKVEGANSGYYR